MKNYKKIVEMFFMIFHYIVTLVMGIGLLAIFGLFIYIFVEIVFATR